VDNEKRRAHILVVEDEEHLATGIKYNLDAEGYQVTTVGDGPAALKVIAENPGGVDLVVLDLMLPGMSGYSVCQTLRATDRDLPVMMLSARTLAEDRARGFDVGANQYLTKPFDLDEFLSRVNNLLAFHSRREQQRAAQPSVPDSFEFGSAKINFATFQVTVAGQAVRMTQLEMALLRYFVENEGRVISRHELLENVWNMPGSVQTRAPDQFIRRLRKTFEPDPTQPQHFLTIRDAGYRFVTKPEPA
jgi:two-component system OmpR family response regulator